MPLVAAALSVSVFTLAVNRSQSLRRRRMRYADKGVGTAPAASSPLAPSPSAPSPSDLSPEAGGGGNGSDGKGGSDKGFGDDGGGGGVSPPTAASLEHASGGGSGTTSGQKSRPRPTYHSGRWGAGAGLLAGRAAGWLGQGSPSMGWGSPEQRGRLEPGKGAATRRITTSVAGTASLWGTPARARGTPAHARKRAQGSAAVRLQGSRAALGVARRPGAVAGSPSSSLMCAMR